MTFTKVDQETWPRKECFNHYFTQVPCTYSAVFNLDITALRQRGAKLYPTMLYLLSTVVNRHQEFRMACNQAGEVGIYDVVHPCYTIFHRDTETFPTYGPHIRPIIRPFARHTSRTPPSMGTVTACWPGLIPPKTPSLSPCSRGPAFSPST